MGGVSSFGAAGVGMFSRVFSRLQEREHGIRLFLQ